MTDLGSLSPATPVQVPAPIDYAALAARVRRGIRRNTHQAVRSLRVEIDAQSVRLQGRCGTFYIKQLAQQAAMRLVGFLPCDNQIEVDW